ncbi:acetyl-CoA carboxylase biotin carboxyl carrier protein [Anaerosacchariphilus polymeriproducens]|uniref:Biotin carboxyl carrier protein of acetyl-CoA carboxylase n=1 Tax=Anaerosacchariphilus polymeriproducens TaxID=1812858 RepID=A0A371AUR1_9FIRM|nr:acetyl-CoA carboxylase biotin carboxyl carrier protein [Anaerosacchariphilus polymeriproducens]RDU23313.1 acetyl-CoA carboxylase biotin carboxyl carrier protein [Anaerosacchariphilus polymeriproducens]
MEFENIIRLIESVSKSNLTDFQLEQNDFKIKMKTDKGQKVITTTQMPVHVTQAQMHNVEAQMEAPVQVQQDNNENKLTGNVVKCPLVGTFYSSPSPEDGPYVKVGDTVKKGQTLGIVEAMKLMNDIECEFDGVVKEILVQNEDKVEFNQPLFIIE